MIAKQTEYTYSNTMQPYIGGRRFATGPSLQTSLRCIRAVLCKGATKRDKDIRRAHASITKDLVEVILRQNPSLKGMDFPALRECTHDPSKVEDLVKANLK